MTIKCLKCHFENPDTVHFCGECGTQLISKEEIPVTETLETPTEELTRGTTFANRYEIIEELGKGGMGKVYRVEDKKIKEEVALKLIKPEIASDKKTIERFSNELKMARKIAHRNVCKMYDLGEEKGSHYITMEYVPGQDLKGLIRQTEQLIAGKSISIAKQICEGLSEAHRLGVIHRDLKPSNIMIDKEGNARIMDFGIARSLKAKGITGARVIVGTPEYMSPEQVESKEVDQRSDIYSLGVILYEMVTGRAPFDGESPLSVAIKHKTEAPPDPKKINTQIPEDLSRLILRCMEKDREKRYQGAGEVRSELANIEKRIPTTDKVISKKKPITSKEITVTFGLKKLFIPALVFIALVIVVMIIWQPWSQKEAIPIPSDKPYLAIMYFENNTGDESLDHWRSALPEWLITDLAQSRYIKVMSGDRLLNILKKLNLLEAKKYDSADLKAVASEGRVNHILKANLSKAGDTFRIDYAVQEISSGESMGSGFVMGKGEASFPAMVDELTRKIKANFKLSSEEIASDNDKEVGKITTSSPEAYKFYSNGRKYYFSGDSRQSIPFMERAIEIDPEFAMAYRSLAMSHGNLGNTTEHKKYFEKAFELSDRASDVERYRIQADYYNFVEENYDRAIEAYNKLFELDPDNLARHNLALIYANLEEWDKAIEHMEVDRKNKTEFIITYTNLGYYYNAKGMYQKAREIYQDYINNFSDSAIIHAHLANNYACEGKYDLALAEIDKAIFLDPNATDYYWVKGHIYHFQGHFERAEKVFARLPDSGQLERTKRGALSLIDLTRGKMKKPRSLVYQAFTPILYPNRFDEIGRLFGNGLKYVAEKNFTKAEENANELRLVAEREMKLKKVRLSDYLMGMIELESNNLEKAIEYFINAVSLMPNQTPSRFEQAFMISPLALAYYKSGQLEKSKEQYQRITSLTYGRLYNGDIYAKSFYMLGKIYEQQGDTAKAIEQYEKFLTLWKDADPGIAEVEDAKKRLAGLKS